MSVPPPDAARVDTALHAVDAGLRLIGLALDHAARERVAEQWLRVSQFIDALALVELDVHDQPPQDFVPGAEPAP